MLPPSDFSLICPVYKHILRVKTTHFISGWGGSGKRRKNRERENGYFGEDPPGGAKPQARFELKEISFFWGRFSDVPVGVRQVPHIQVLEDGMVEIISFRMNDDVHLFFPEEEVRFLRILPEPQHLSVISLASRFASPWKT